MRAENLSMLVTTVHSELRTGGRTVVGHEILGDGIDVGRAMT